MIVRSHNLPETTLEEKDGKFILTKAQDIRPILEENYAAKKDEQNGWSKDRSIRRVASVPFLTWIEWTRKYPELVAGDKELRENTLKKLLHSEEGQMYWTVERGV